MQPIPINIAVEDPLSEAVLRKILLCSEQPYIIGSCFSRGGFGYLKKSIRGFNNAAKGIPFLVLTDLDRTGCAPMLIREWLPISGHRNLMLRVAVREVEAWILADRSAFATFLMISKNLVPVNADEIDDPKRLVVNLARKSKQREVRKAIVPGLKSTAKVGPDYNGSLMLFAERFWNIDEAVKNSPSLERTVRAVKEFQPEFR